MRRVPQAGWRILVALDGTQQALRALTYAAALAREANGMAVLIRAADPAVASGPYSALASVRHRRLGNCHGRAGSLRRDPLASGHSQRVVQFVDLGRAGFRQGEVASHEPGAVRALILSGVLSVIFGVLLVAQPGAGALALLWLIGLYAVIFGIALLVLAWWLRGLAEHMPNCPRARRSPRPV